MLLVQITWLSRTVSACQQTGMLRFQEERREHLRLTQPLHKKGIPSQIHKRTGHRVPAPVPFLLCRHHFHSRVSKKMLSYVEGKWISELLARVYILDAPNINRESDFLIKSNKEVTSLEDISLLGLLTLKVDCYITTTTMIWKFLHLFLK